MATLFINQTGHGNVQRITISNGRVVADGKDVTPEGKQISIVVQGDLEALHVDACDTVTVAGNWTGTPFTRPRTKPLGRFAWHRSAFRGLQTTAPTTNPLYSSLL